MKKLINTALVYLIAGAAAGVFFREFTNFAQFTGQTTLGLMHPHLLVLGFAVFLIATLFALQDDFTGDKRSSHSTSCTTLAWSSPCA